MKTAQTAVRLKEYRGSADLLGPGLHELARGVWITSGRTAVVEGENALALIDPGDEPILDGDRPIGPLGEVLGLSISCGKPVNAVLITHAHPDHVQNLPALLAFAEKSPHFASPRVVAHANSPLRHTDSVEREGRLEVTDCLAAIPLIGHSPHGDDLAFYHPKAKILFAGDLVQPKGESWEETFYPSPYPYFTDGEGYVNSLDRLLSLPFETLVTGHREVRFYPSGRAWVELTRRAIRAVGEEVSAWRGDPDPLSAGREIFRRLCRERGLGEHTVEARMSPPGESSFDRYDLPGIMYYWNRRRKDV